MKILKISLLTSIIFLTTEIFSQDLPETYQAMFNEIVEFFSQIRGSNSVTKGNTLLTVFSENKITLRLEYKKSVKNLTFETTPNEEGNGVWKAANQLTIDMINKHEDVVRKELETMYKLAKEKSKE